MNESVRILGESKIQYSIIGDGPPLFLVHGYQADSRIWGRVVSLLKGSFTLIIPDLPGHGQSPLIRVVNDMDFLADILFKISLAMGINGVSIVGHSMGGYIALSFARLYAQYVDSIVLVNSHPFEDSFNKVLSRERESQLIEIKKSQLLINKFIKNSFSSEFAEKYPEIIKEYAKIALVQQERGMLADLAGMMARNDRIRTCEKLRRKSLIILGAEDDTVPEHLFRSVKEYFEFETILHCGHMSIIEKPNEVAELIREKVFRDINYN